MSKVVIFGLGTAAEVASYYFETDTEHEVAGFAVDSGFCDRKSFCGLPVADFKTVESLFDPADHLFFVAVGYSRMNDFRAEKVRQAKAKGYGMASYISSRATVFPDLSHLENAFILENNTIQPFVRIGHNVTIWSGTHVGHHSTIGDNTFISSQIVISGGVTVGRNCFLGVNATVLENLKIADYSLVAAAALINRNTEPYGVYMGAPAKKTATPSSHLPI
jgi:sugar O-acyltransferase (sialic acid O-acetyltransferase NeuD family)